MKEANYHLCKTQSLIFLPNFRSLEKNWPNEARFNYSQYFMKDGALLFISAIMHAPINAKPHFSRTKFFCH